GEEVAGGDLRAVLHVDASGVLDLVDALLDVLERDRDPAVAVHGHLAGDRRRHVRLALGPPLGLREWLTGNCCVAIGDREHVTSGDADRHGVILRIAHDDLPRAVRVTDDLGDAVDLADNGHALWHARLEELFDARQAHGDVLTDGGDATGVERTHRELGARLADGLRGDDAVLVAAILDADDDVLRHVHATTRQVARVRRPDGGVGETLSSTVRRDEVLEDREALAEVRTDRQVDDAALGVGDEPTHTTD